MVGDDTLRASIGRQRRVQQLQERRKILMFRGHPRQNGAGVAFENTDTIDPSALQLDKIANIDKPEVMSIMRAIGQVFWLERCLLLITGAGPWTGRPVDAPIDGHGPSD